MKGHVKITDSRYLGVSTRRMVSVIIPTLNEAKCIGSTLAALASHPGDFEVIVVDGGSTDDTVLHCRSFPQVHFFEAQIAQRAHQMNLGAEKAQGEILLFLHADTHPPQNFVELIQKELVAEEVVGGSFSLKFDTRHWLLSVISRVTRFNFPWLTFGDHGMFVRRTVFQAMNGFSELPILEDLDLQRRLRRKGKFARPNASVRTSARRFVNNGVLRQTVRDVCILTAYFLGVAPETLAKFYPNSVSVAR